MDSGLGANNDVKRGTTTKRNVSSKKMSRICWDAIYIYKQYNIYIMVLGSFGVNIITLIHGRDDE